MVHGFAPARIATFLITSNRNSPSEPLWRVTRQAEYAIRELLIKARIVGDSIFISLNLFTQVGGYKPPSPIPKTQSAYHPRARQNAFDPQGLWIAPLGPSVEKGIVGIGFTAEGALRAFDVQYMAGRRFAE